RGDRKCRGVSRRAERVRLVRQVSLVLRRWEADRQQVQNAQGRADLHKRIRRAEQGPGQARVQVRRDDDLLRDDAGDWDGERSRGRLLPAQASHQPMTYATAAPMMHATPMA